MGSKNSRYDRLSQVDSKLDLSIGFSHVSYSWIEIEYDTLAENLLLEEEEGKKTIFGIRVWELGDKFDSGGIIRAKPRATLVKRARRYEIVITSYPLGGVVIAKGVVPKASVILLLNRLTVLHVPYTLETCNLPDSDML